ncbi:C1 family peptidase [Maribacter confluentis]|uniref:C1 family peptidase n=1 Tax=Maribacter confluentis TaxID=1656093 RepID=A0ABT8RSH3_9FLAO|nr:C1 family peptidase [Maribacter confluentis]MDO1513061.1 C1 family peptidase [Maribacter confluentis]
MRTLLFFSLCISGLAFGQVQPKTGLLFDDEAYEQTPVKARNVSFQDVVTEVANASLKQFVPQIKNQSTYSTCVGWASAYYGRTILESRLRNETDSIQINQHTFSPVFTYLNSNVENDYNCSGGAFIGKAMETMVEKGVPFFKDFDVMCETTISDELLKKAQANKIKDFTRLFGAEDEDVDKVDNVKRSIINGNPVIMGFMVESSFFSAKNVYEPDNLGTDGGHAMCVIGFDDDKYGGAFEVVNSWGASWGNNGYMWIRYNDFPTYTRYAFEMIPFSAKPKEKKMLAGELQLLLRDGSTMNIARGKGDYEGSVFGYQDVVIEDDEESIGDYSTVERFPVDTRYRIKTKVDQPAYVYVMGWDSDNEGSLLFPETDSISPYINSNKEEVTIPYAPKGKKAYFRLNKEVDSDHTIVIFSLEKIDLPNVKKQMETMEGNLMDKLYVVFNDKLIPKDNMVFNEDSMGFQAEFEEGSMAMLILDINRS